MTQFAKKIRLTNGLTVIYEKNPAADIVSLQIGVRVGAVNESDDESGLCHLIEHMVFKGTKSFKPGEIATIVEASGGELNAYTSLDQTVYYVNVPVPSFVLGMKILKEMAFDAVMDPEELAREKEVVVEEINRGKDNPQRVLAELLFSSFYLKHPYRRPVIGTAELVRGFSPEKVSGFYKKWYRPQNMVLGVCGNIEESQLSEELERNFRFEIPSPDTHQQFKPDPEIETYRVVAQKMDIQATYFDVAFRAPHVLHADVPALDVLSHLLGEGDTSLLEQNTKEKEQLVHYIYSSCYTPKHPGMFVIGGMVDPVKMNDALLSIRRQIDRVKSDLFDSERLERVKMLAQAQLIFDKETCEGTARKWMTYETTAGDYKYDEKYIEAVLALTPDDLLRVAKTYLDPGKALLAVLHPPKAKIRPDKAFFREKIRTPSTKFERVSRYKEVEVYRLKNGLSVVLKQNRRLPIASLKLTGLGGLRFESARNNGVSNLASHAVVKGTRKMNQLQVAEKCESMAGQLAGYAGRNSWGGSLGLLSGKLKEGVPFFADVMLDPAFDDDEIAKEKRLQLEAIKNRTDNPAQLAFLGAMRKLFAGHPYQYPTLGEKTSVSKLTAEDVRRHYGSLRQPSNMVLSAVGDFDTGALLSLVNEHFGTLPKGIAPKPKLSVPKPPRKTDRIFELKNKNQAHVVVGFVTVPLTHPDRYVFDVLNSVLSGQGGRLFLELRDKKSLAYTVSSSMMEGLETGFFAAYIGTEPGKVPTALSGIFEELEKLRDRKAPEIEIERAKNYIIGNHEIDHQKNGAVAMQLALNQLYGVGVAEYFDFVKRVRKVTAKDVMRVAGKYLDPDHCVISVVGPKEAKVW